jgi:hypothetical protein
MWKTGVVFTFILIAFSSCMKAPSYSKIPHIDFMSVSSSYTVNNAVDTITFSFTDGDGDIYTTTSGSGDSCASDSLCGVRYGDSSCLKLPDFNIFLIDNRDSCVSFFASPNLQPSGKYKAISGTLEVITSMQDLKCFNCTTGCPLDSVVYAIILRDQAGHFSNTIHTTPIAVACQ